MNGVLKKGFTAIVETLVGERDQEVVEMMKMLEDVNPPSHMLQKDGTILTKHGRSILPMRVHVSPGGGLRIHSGYYSQPRVRELMKQLAPLLNNSAGDSVFLNEETGDFSLMSDKGKILGQIDVLWESRMLSFAKDQILAQKIVAQHRGFHFFD